MCFTYNKNIGLNKDTRNKDTVLKIKLRKGICFTGPKDQNPHGKIPPVLLLINI